MKTKKEARQFYQDERKALSLEERHNRSERIADRYMQLFEKEKPQVVHLFLPIASKAEVNTLIILRWLNEEFPKVKTVTSIIAEDNESLLTLEVRSDTPLQVNRWGIPEPISRIYFPEEYIEEVLTPLLAVDQDGYRLGYGKGFYDRFFSTCAEGVLRTGLNFFAPVEDTLPRDDWDIPLHRLISPEGVVDFSGQL